MSKTSQALGDERLLKLAEFLETKVPRRHFDMWEFGGDRSDMNRIAGGEKGACETAACAAGWCPILFRRQWKMVGRYPRLRSSIDTTESGFGTYQDCEDFFSVNRDAINELFAPQEDNRTPMAWAKKVRRFVASRQENQ